MNPIDYIKQEMAMSEAWILGLAADMKNAPLTAPTANGGNHPLWIVGHLAYSEANNLNTYILGRENPWQHWKDIFSIGSHPVYNLEGYPSFDEVMEAFRSARGETVAYLDSITDDDLDNPTHAPAELAAYFGTVGQCLAIMTMHLAFHGGQIADARRSAGRGVLMA